jgi:hypothetical protein
MPDVAFYFMQGAATRWHRLLWLPIKKTNPESAFPNCTPETKISTVSKITNFFLLKIVRELVAYKNGL